MMSTPTQHRLVIDDVNRRDLTHNAAGRPVMYEWDVTASGPDGLSFRFVLPADQVPIPGGEVLVTWSAQVARP